MKRLALHQLLGVTFPILLGILITRLLLADVSLEYINAYALVLALLPLASLLELGQDYHLITNISDLHSCTSYILNASGMPVFKCFNLVGSWACLLYILFSISNAWVHNLFDTYYRLGKIVEHVRIPIQSFRIL